MSPWRRRCPSRPSTNAFGSKAALLKRLYDVRVVGDDMPVPFADCPEVRALELQTDPRRFVAGFGELAGQMLTRHGPLLAVVIEGDAAGGTDLRELLETAGHLLVRGRGWSDREYATWLGRSAPDLLLAPDESAKTAS